MAADEKHARPRLSVLQLAETLDNVSEAYCAGEDAAVQWSHRLGALELSCSPNNSNQDLQYGFSRAVRLEAIEI
jgi:hypothetical protein